VFAAVGAEIHDKQKTDPALFARSRAAAESLEACAEIGGLRHALSASSFTRKKVHENLAEIAAERKSGRRSAEETTLFDRTGLGLQDVAAAAVI
jgi:ornithine cyclodeaminase/alanine dehydrogenase-like protein (mu-crystallin family)